MKQGWQCTGKAPRDWAGKTARAWYEATAAQPLNSNNNKEIGDALKKGRDAPDKDASDLCSRRPPGRRRRTSKICAMTGPRRERGERSAHDRPVRRAWAPGRAKDAGPGRIIVHPAGLRRGFRCRGRGRPLPGGHSGGPPRRTRCSRGGCLSSRRCCLRGRGRGSIPSFFSRPPPGSRA